MTWFKRVWYALVDPMKNDPAYEAYVKLRREMDARRTLRQQVDNPEGNSHE